MQPITYRAVVKWAPIVMAVVGAFALVTTIGFGTKGEVGAAIY